MGNSRAIFHNPGADVLGSCSKWAFRLQVNAPRGFAWGTSPQHPASLALRWMTYFRLMPRGARLPGQGGLALWCYEERRAEGKNLSASDIGTSQTAIRSRPRDFAT
jgi:hypothetical protein